MKRKILIFIYLLLSISSVSQIFKSDMYTNKGLELMRESNFNQILGLEKQSGSLQTFEIYTTKNQNINSKGVILGTSSNFINKPNIFLGLTVAYEKYKFQERKGFRDYALNTLISYKLENNLIIASLGYDQGKNISKRENSVNLELGKFLSNNTYTYIGVKSFDARYKEINNIKYSNFQLGISRYDYFNKFRLTNNIELNSDNKKYDPKNREKLNFTFYSSLSYYIYDDLLVEIKYRGTKNSKFYSNLFSVGFSHSF